MLCELLEEVTLNLLTLKAKLKELPDFANVVVITPNHEPVGPGKVDITEVFYSPGLVMIEVTPG